jgi:hypothetical protein
MCSDPRFVERSLPIRKTVLGAPPFMDRRLAPFATEPADIFARPPFLRGAVNRLARWATEIDANFVGIHHAAVASSAVGKGGNSRQLSRWPWRKAMDLGAINPGQSASGRFNDSRCRMHGTHLTWHAS